jgi:hypothetical protein
VDGEVGLEAFPGDRLVGGGEDRGGGDAALIPGPRCTGFETTVGVLWMGLSCGMYSRYRGQSERGLVEAPNADVTRVIFAGGLDG